MCSSPILAAYTGLRNPETNGLQVKMLFGTEWNLRKAEDHYGIDNVFTIPCGQCDDCRSQYKRDWAVRCMAELTEWQESSFITLTYDDEHYPGQLVRKDLTDFIKRLRKRLNHEVKTFYCGEYGSTTFRGHYHLIIFGYYPLDYSCKMKFENGLHQKFYVSEELSELWPFGLHSVSQVNKNTCAYVAGYTSKKDNPVLEGFVGMSRNPGLGMKFFEDRVDVWKVTGHCTVPGVGIVSVPRAAYKFLDEEDLKKLRKLKMDKQRLKINNQTFLSHYEFRDMAVKDKLTKRKKRKRGL